jgi:hypothetical protein
VNRLRVVPIVEGHGEVQCVRKLIERIWTELLNAEYVEVLQPIRRKRQLLTNQTEIEKSVEFALKKLANDTSNTDPRLVLLLLDADDAKACELGPQLLGYASSRTTDCHFACVIAVSEYETWFVAAAESLRSQLSLADSEVIPEDPEARKLGKGWIRRRYPRYSETVDQPKFTAVMDLVICRQRSPSFDKLCRELEKCRDSQPSAESRSDSP